MKIVNFESDYGANKELSYTESVGELCTLEHFTKEVKSYYDDFELDEAICMKSGMPIKLLNSGKIIQQLEITFEYCDTS